MLAAAVKHLDPLEVQVVFVGGATMISSASATAFTGLAMRPPRRLIWAAA